MKPRIFISSTFYDLKYIREDISNFVKAHDFEPILFEDGDIGYTSGQPLDESCYDTMKNADMVILIIGGNYGSPATGETDDEFDEYLSVTRKEFTTAVNEGIPVYAFVESAVYAEYGVYDCNLKNIEERKIELAFKATKSINVFRFIKEIYALSKIPVTEFRKPSEIKDFMSKQWADMFKSYLKQLREKNDTKQIYEAMDNLQSLIKKMDIMVDGLGQKVMGDGKVTYDKVLKEQTRVRAREYAKKIADSFVCEINGNTSKQKATETVFETIKKALKCISDLGDDIKSTREVLDVLSDTFTVNEYVSFKEISLSFFKNWENYIEICNNKELEQEVLKILLNDFYNSRLFSIRTTEDEVEE